MRDIIKEIRESLKEINFLADIGIITELKCENDKCTCKIRLPEYDKNGKFKISEKIVVYDLKEKRIVEIKEI